MSSAQVEYLKAEIAKLRDELRVRPIHYSRGGASPTPEPVEIWLQVVDGNTLVGGLLGIKKINALLASQVVWRDPYDTATFPDGLGRAFIWRNGVQGLVRDASVWLQNTAYNVGDKVRGTNPTEAFVCTVAGTSAASGTGPSGTGTGIVDGTCEWDYDATVGWKPEQVLALNDNRAQWPFALAETEWAKVFSSVSIGSATNPSTGATEDLLAYPLAFI